MNTSHTGVSHRINLGGIDRPSPFSSLKVFFYGLIAMAVVYMLLAASTVWAAGLAPMSNGWSPDPASVIIAKGDKEKNKDKDKADEDELVKTPDTLPDYSKYKLTDDEDLDNIKDDDYDRIIKKVREEEKAEKQPSKIDKIEEELRKLDEAEKIQQAEEAKRQEAEFRAESKARLKEIKDFDGKRKDAREDISDEGDDEFPVIEDEDINWNGLYD